MNAFQYVSATTPDEAIGLIGKNGRYLGGGIDLLGEMKDYIISPDVLVNVKGINTDKKVTPFTLQDVNTKASLQLLAISSSMTVSELAEHPDIVTKLYPGLSPALTHAAALTAQAHLEHLIEDGKASRTFCPNRSSRS